MLNFWKFFNKISESNISQEFESGKTSRNQVAAGFKHVEKLANKHLVTHPDYGIIGYYDESKGFISNDKSKFKSGEVPEGAIKHELGWVGGKTNLDLGGGKYDKGLEFLKNKEINAHLYDPMRTTGHTEFWQGNKKAWKSAGDGKSDSVTLFNVLNVIKEDEVIESILKNAHSALKPHGILYITVYYNSKFDPVGRVTSDGYQRNEPLKNYLPKVRSVFPNAVMSGKMIIATK